MSLTPEKNHINETTINGTRLIKFGKYLMSYYRFVGMGHIDILLRKYPYILFMSV